MTPEPLGDVRAELGEAPVWSPQEGALRWLDILGQTLHVTDPATGATVSTALPRRTSFLAPRTEGGWVCGAGRALRVLGEDGNGEVIAALPGPLDGDRFNDGKPDPQGRMWTGTANAEGRFDCALWRFDPTGPGVASATKMAGDVAMSNGLGWSPDQRVLYHADSSARTVWAWDFQAETGTISRRRAFYTTGDNEVPDGLSVDVDGHVWLACWGGSRLARIAPDGQEIASIRFPTPRVSSCAFGGDDLSTLFVTTACEGADDRERARDRHMGGLFRLDPGVAGLPVAAYAG